MSQRVTLELGDDQPAPLPTAGAPVRVGWEAPSGTMVWSDAVCDHVARGLTQSIDPDIRSGAMRVCACGEVFPSRQGLLAHQSASDDALCRSD